MKTVLRKLYLAVGMLVVFSLIVGGLADLETSYAAPVLLSQGKPAVASSVEASFVAADAVDGNTGTRWSSLFSDPQWIYVDLGQTATIERVVLRWEAAYGRAYQIQVSNDASTWTSIYSTSSGDGGVDDLTVSGSGRYVRMYGTQRATPYGYSLWEFEVYGTVGSSTNLALNKPVTYSGEQAGNEAYKAVDGSTSTRWAVLPWPQWIRVDLGATYSINKTEIMPYSSRAYQYRIEVSTDGSSYTTAVDKTNNTTGGATLTDTFGPVNARYVRLTVTGASGYTGQWVSLYEFRVFGGGTQPTPTPQPGQQPYGGTPWAVPGTIQAENYDTGGEGTAYHDTTAGNAGPSTYRPGDDVDIEACTDSGGGYDVGWITSGEWLEYTVNVASSGTYHLQARVASGASGGQLRVEVDGTNVTGAMSFGATGGWQSWNTLTSQSFSLTAGQHVMRVVMEANEFNLNWISVASGPGPTPTPSPTPPGPRTLVWSDEFEGTSLDLNNWTYMTGGSGWGNNELEYYTAGDNVRIEYDARVGSRVLIIEARKENPANYQCWYGPCTYTSSRLNTRGKREFKYGRMEARLSIPMGKGLWPAFWSMGINGGWPACGETDIMEHINTETRTHGYMHWDNGGHQQTGGNTPVADPTAYHVYAIEWDATEIRWYVDDTHFATGTILNNVNGTEEFHQPFYFLLNLAVGGNWPGSPDSSTAFPARYYVDYVRVYQ